MLSKPERKTLQKMADAVVSDGRMGWMRWGGKGTDFNPDEARA